MIGTNIQFDSLRRRIVLVPILCAHAVVLALLASQQPLPILPRHDASLVMFDVVDDHSRPPPRQTPAPVRPSRAAPAIVQIAAVVPAIEPALRAEISDEPAIVAGGCDLTDVVQAALRVDDAARADLAALPAAARSVANAVMLWDGRWIDAAPSRAALAHVRAVVLATIGAASADCRLQLQAGPRLIAIPGPPDTVLAIGSGRWRWNDLAGGVAPRAIASSDDGAGRPQGATSISTP